MANLYGFWDWARMAPCKGPMSPVHAHSFWAGLCPEKLVKKKYIYIYSRTSLIWTPKGQSDKSVLEKCPYKRGHYDDVIFMTPLAVLSVQ